MLAPPKPPADDPDLLIKEARERQLRRRLVSAAGIAIAAALGLSVYAFVIGGSPANLAQPPAHGGRATGAPCRASQLAATVGFQGATQTLVGGADIKNTGDRACSLPAGWPIVRLTSDGKQLAVEPRRPAPSARPTPAHVLAPGETSVVEMQWANWCGTAHALASHGGIAESFLVLFSIRLGPGLVVSAPTTGGPPCLAPKSVSTLIVDRARIDQ